MPQLARDHQLRLPIGHASVRTHVLEDRRARGRRVAARQARVARLRVAVPQTLTAIDAGLLRMRLETIDVVLYDIVLM